MTISVEQVKQLREKTGAGIMGCKEALVEADGDLDEAVAILRKRGIQIATKREARTAAEGVVWAYVHAGEKLGVLVEVNCETDFVARTDDFRDFAKNVAMQVAAQQPRWVSADDVPEAALAREREILTEQAEAEGKPDHIVEQIVEGRLQKFYASDCLLDQPYIRDDSMTIQDLLNDLVANTGEKVVIRRFVRYQVGEELD